MWFAMHDGLDRCDQAAFRTAFGDAFEDYVLRVLRRCSARSRTRVARVDEAAGDQRCDFAWRSGDDLVLIDAKRASVPANDLMGGTEIWKTVERNFHKALRQLLATAEMVQQGGLAEAAPELGLPPGWMPRRIFPVVIHHRPLFLWFDTGDRLVSSAGVSPRWSECFAAAPSFWSVSDIEAMERALFSRSINPLLDALAARHPLARVGLKEFFRGAQYPDPSADYYRSRFRQRA